MHQFQKTPLSHEEQQAVKRHLQFIDHLTRESIKHGYRTIISGGYAVDGAIGLITRPHEDVDIQLYGTDVLNPVLLAEICLTGQYSDLMIEDHGRDEYWHKFLISEIGAETYYIRVATKPFSDSKIVIKSDGKYSEEHDFDTKVVVLNGVRFEIQSPVIELADKLSKREHRGDPKLQKHEQDIQNLRLITDSYDVQETLQKLIKKHKN
ncbi:MAG TPA: hypothetical protein PLD54_02220 [Candidatus Levybacteria bacterium]|nr:hypothetical protein [Candidatus Levybacteria bacterium]